VVEDGATGEEEQAVHDGVEACAWPVDGKHHRHAPSDRDGAEAADDHMRRGAQDGEADGESPEAERAAEGRGVHPQLWQACAGSLCAVPPVGAAVYYFPQGHAEHAGAAAVDLRAAGVRVSPFVPCRVAAVRLTAEPDTDDIYARIRLVPLRPWEPVADMGDALMKSDGSSRGGGAGDGDGQ